jgi:hypothetical protein
MENGRCDGNVYARMPEISDENAKSNHAEGQKQRQERDLKHK